MKCLVNAMFLGSHSGTKENGEIYYYGSFMEKESKRNFNLYFDDNKYLQNLIEDKWYSVPCLLVLSSMVNNENRRVNVWKILPDKEGFKL